MAEITEVVNKIRFQSPTSRFCILVLKSGLSAIGEMSDPLEGEEVTFQGKYHDDSKWGRQFKFTAFERTTPVGMVAIRHYIVRVAKWVGNRTADRLIDTFKENTLKMLKDQPDEVAAAIPGITVPRAREISKILKSKEDEERILLEVGELCAGRVSEKVMADAVKKWESDTPGVIRANPYDLTEIRGCGFKGADRVAAGLEITGQDPRRLAAAIKYVLGAAAGRHGHTKMHKADCLEEAGELCGCAITPEGIDMAMENGVSACGQYTMLDHLRSAETIIANNIRRIATNCDMNSLIDKHPPVDVEGMADDQIESVLLLSKSPIGLLVGPPGTGKTWTLARYIEPFSKNGRRIAFCAPTGKAAKKMTEALADTCGGEATTIHRLLQPTMGKSGMEFNRDEGNPIEYDYLVVDETSMLDVRLGASLLSAVPNGCRVLFIGDDHQLPSVGPGAVLRDMIESGIPCARLTEIKRNKGDIVLACHSIKDGVSPQPRGEKLDVETGANWRHVECSSPIQIVATVEMLATDWARSMDIDQNDLIVVSPFNHKNERDMSCRDFNARLKLKLNPPKNSWIIAAGGITNKDRVVRLSNGVVPGIPGFEVENAICENLDLRNSRIEQMEWTVVNGDVGTVIHVAKKGILVKFENPNRYCLLGRADADITLAYALTCHKMQGSEAKVIVVPMHKSFGIFPCREWAYTALSRAKEILITVGTLRTLGTWVSRETNSQRQTSLTGLL